MMKKKVIVLNLIMVLAVFTLSAGNLFQEPKGPVLSFEKDLEDIGRVFLDDMPEGNRFELDILFTNTGDEPLVISNVRACCGTRVLDYPKQPVMPEEEGTIKVEFRLAPRAQRVNRTVTVSYNSLQHPSVIHRIIGEVSE